ncbi:MAG: hypothetical protein JWQ29_700 [Phenylobacterium sp.]|nr:hypothetical protein [Phenylobacterium sp.]
MQKHVFTTAMGEVWAWGPEDALTNRKPVVLFINGAFAIERPRTWGLQDHLPEAAVLNIHLPGNHGPPLIAHGVGAYAAAYDDVLRQLGRPALAVGASVGGLAAMAMRGSLLRGLVLLEPPLLTGKLWPLEPSLRQRLRDAPDDEPLRAFIWTVFGISAEAQAERDYRHLLDGLERPAWLLLGGEPLFPPRALDQLPSLLDEPEREAFRAHGRVQVREIPGIGHNIGGRAIGYVTDCVRDLLVRELGVRPAASLAAGNDQEVS